MRFHWPVFASVLIPALLAQTEGKILRPVDGAAVEKGPLSVIATAPQGKLELDGAPIRAEEPFANVYHATIEPVPGKHKLAIVWEGGRKEITFFSGEGAPQGFEPFRSHPPAAVECTQCHGLSRRGRFRFQGGCFECHVEDAFTTVHPHPVHILEQCGFCHNAHGHTAKALMIHPRETACKLCHN